MLRSELTITPSDSAHRAAGSNTSAYSLVSVSKKASWAITNSARSRPASTVFRLATEATGLVQMIQHALISPSAMRENMSTVPVPTSRAQRPAGNAPLVLDEVAVVRGCHRPLARQIPVPCNPFRGRPSRWAVR